MLINPIDCHVHCREGKLMHMVAPYIHKYFKTAIVMPNLVKPIRSIDQVQNYKHTLSKYFGPMMTMYFDIGYDRKILEEAQPLIASIKMYPKGMTTNSDHGVDFLNDGVAINKVLEVMEKLEIPLSVHAEAAGYHEDREMLCIEYINKWAMDFPKLTIIIEHIGDRRVLPLLDLDGLYATITPHHLLLTGDDYVGPPLNVHNYCLPVCKRPEDRRALFEAVTGDYKDKVMLGTDSAPHTKGDKERKGCGGIFSTPVALLAVAQVFDNDKEVMQRFCSTNACKLHRLDFGDSIKVVDIEHAVYDVPMTYNNNLVPLYSGKTLAYRYSTG